MLNTYILTPERAYLPLLLISRHLSAGHFALDTLFSTEEGGKLSVEDKERCWLFGNFSSGTSLASWIFHDHCDTI